ncbi:CDP-alcohol phosphatidyltransferase family protein [Paenibacillus wynnii]|uniref:Phosphatidylglycerophosphate synthase n=1 Tax=Paenibacillus wynnii TaxID=268407 RepID=A0A098MAZ3_9BACL|nr:CDP-alcohol phosphatidyltransferase family protein [Paenibacillus wynnii]KGE19715.1 hypothetical protein PWYN_10450 [Paenibacillus wynnii]
MKSLANSISLTRIFLALALVVVKPLGIAFLSIYLICGMSDVLDGYIARKTDTASKLGEKLDSIADLILVVILIAVLFPLLTITVQILAWVIIIGIIRAVSMLVVFAKYKTFGILHTYGNKITGLVLFAFPLSLAFVPSEVVVMFIMCAVASLSAVEELLIHLSSHELQANRKSLFLK